LTKLHRQLNGGNFFETQCTCESEIDTYTHIKPKGTCISLAYLSFFGKETTKFEALQHSIKQQIYTNERTKVAFRRNMIKSWFSFIFTFLTDHWHKAMWTFGCNYHNSYHKWFPQCTCYLLVLSYYFLYFVSDTTATFLSNWIVLCFGKYPITSQSISRPHTAVSGTSRLRGARSADSRAPIFSEFLGPKFIF